MTAVIRRRDPVDVPTRLVAVVNVDGKITAAPAPQTPTDRLRPLHDDLWSIEPGPEHAERRDAARSAYFALHRKLRGAP